MWRRGTLYGAGMSGVRLVPSGDVRVSLIEKKTTVKGLMVS